MPSEGILTKLFSFLYQHITDWVQLLLEGGPYQYFVRNHIATCDFPEG